MARKKKTGDARTTVTPQKSQAGTRTTTAARIGKERAQHRSTIPLHITEPFWSEAYKAYRVEAVEHFGATFETKQSRSIFFSEMPTAIDAYDKLRHCKDWDEWDAAYLKLKQSSGVW